MKTIYFKRVLSIFLTFLIIFTAFECSLPAFAEDDPDEEMEEFEISGDPEVLYEDVCQRTEYSKTFVLSNGSMRTEDFSSQVHVLNNNGIFEEITEQNAPEPTRGNNIPVTEVEGTYVSSSTIRAWRIPVSGLQV